MSLISDTGSGVYTNVVSEQVFDDANRDLSLDERAALIDQFHWVRRETESLTDPLSAEDMQLQSMADTSPSKWHLAHTSWFFETFLLRDALPGYRVFDQSFHHIFNSYYNSLGQPFSRPQRGLLSRPSIEQVFSYRAHIDRHIEQWLIEEDVTAAQAELLTLGIHHEQQHQELLLTDIKHAFSQNPVYPAYREDLDQFADEVDGGTPLEWLHVPEDHYTLGSDGEGFGFDSFSFDNEGPAHQRFQPAFRIASRLITNGEYLEFLQDGGYREPRLWLSDGWSHIQQTTKPGVQQAPLYWREIDGEWFQFTLAGLQPLDLNAPVCHVSFYEADAYASWAGRRLPTEFEWEIAAWLHSKKDAVQAANLLENRRFQPVAEYPTDERDVQLLGNLWQWTASAYAPYPGYRASSEAVGEYNGKFMCNQMVLRGGSCVTPRSHIRISYRNFFYPHQAWQFTGIRLAGDVQ
ncbi:ergothioneine biosynthesis protein EgtB [Microbulbifer harenosus]|uniref:Ergothioneine biosynthesis protein EgtB n=1 Tax=Microbulbifer harenosus TaxID=2576840 RepID=A0ABY2UFP1_9GAMM|nr:ergothioneine biosynthesis protein EgtB [Microbulbifer harenosus]TLM76419.1 ergothioneine biosynthesis protein EgtB [Microbulbifer harenosus]